MCTIYFPRELPPQFIEQDFEPDININNEENDCFQNIYAYDQTDEEKYFENYKPDEMATIVIIENPFNENKIELENDNDNHIETTEDESNDNKDTVIVNNNVNDEKDFNNQKEKNKDNMENADNHQNDDNYQDKEEEHNILISKEINEINLLIYNIYSFI